MANNTIRKLHSLLSAAFDRAARYGQLGVNPAELAEPPAFKRGDPDPPSPAEAAALLNAAWAEADWGTFLGHSDGGPTTLRVYAGRGTRPTAALPTSSPASCRSRTAPNAFP